MLDTYANYRRMHIDREGASQASAQTAHVAHILEHMQILIIEKNIIHHVGDRQWEGYHISENAFSVWSFWYWQWS